MLIVSVASQPCPPQQGEQDETDPPHPGPDPALLAGQTQAAPTTLGKGEGQLNIVAWAGYVERGETDKNYDWVTGFEKETGCKVNVKTAATSDEMVALMNEGASIW